MTYRQYYEILSETLFNATNSTENQHMLLRGEKGYLNEKGMMAYKRMLFDLYILKAKQDEVLKLFREGDVDIHDDVDPRKLVFTIQHFNNE